MHQKCFEGIGEGHFCAVPAGIKILECVIPVNGEEMMSVRETVALQFQQVAGEQKRKLASLTDNLKLLDSGLDSLSFALIVARLEDALGFDPFDTDDDVKFPVTFGEFVRLYEKKA
jgi:acyl carrier protein